MVELNAGGATETQRRAEQRKADEQEWRVGNIAYTLMKRLSSGIVTIPTYHLAAASAHAGASLRESPIEQTVSFCLNDGTQLRFRNSRDHTQDERAMHLDIQPEGEKSIGVSLQARYRMGMGIHKGLVFLTGYRPQAERTPHKPWGTVEGILDVLDQYLPIDEHAAREARVEVMQFTRG